MKGSNVAVLVAGSWGTALASVLADNGMAVKLWTRKPEQAEEINRTRRHALLPDSQLPAGIVATTDMKEAMSGAAMVLIAAPSGAIRSVTAQMRPYLEADTLVVHAAKGFELGSLKRMSEVIADELPQYDPDQLVVLSGPSHAEEVIRRCPTTIVVAARDLAAAELAQDLLMNAYFRVYTNPDLIGVELGGALKNIIALGGGLSDGLAYGDNAKAALMTRGLAEISRLGIAMGANPLTFAGLAGLGDLVATCTSQHSRNWRAGYALAQGKSVEEVKQAMGMVVEGINTTASACQLAQRYGVEMPISTQLHHVLFDDKPCRQAVQDLMGRGKRHEMEAGFPLH